MRVKLLIALLSLSLTLASHAAQLTVHAAASLTDAMKQVAAGYEKVSQDRIRLNFDASSILARQIEEGAPADLFLSADELRMDELERKGLIVVGTRKTLLTNTLVIVIPLDSNLAITHPTSLTQGDIRKIAISEPSSVPVGIYTKTYLTRLHLWDQLSAKIVPTQNVRASLAAVESGNVQAGFVYKTDALISKKVKIACEIPRREGPRITYPIGMLTTSTNPAAAKKFLTYLESRSALDVFRRFGFTVAE